MATTSRLSGWRRVANAIWRAPSDPQIYGALDVDASAAQRFIEHARAAGHHLTPTHLAGRALAHALKQVPDLNVRLVGGRAYPRPTVDVFFITAVEGGHDLSGVKVVDLPAKSAAALAAELGRRAGELKGGRDAEFSASKAASDALPMPLLRLGVRLLAFATETLQLEFGALGLHASPFGSAMVSGVGMFGLPRGFAPLAWAYDVPVLVLVGEVAEQAVVVDGRVEARPVLPLAITVDHRYVDGWHLAAALRALREYLAAPARFEPALATGG